jgi:hypothetical protein
LRSKEKLRPYICRLMVFSLLTVPSQAPELCGRHACPHLARLGDAGGVGEAAQPPVRVRAQLPAGRLAPWRRRPATAGKPLAAAGKPLAAYPTTLETWPA